MTLRQHGLSDLHLNVLFFMFFVLFHGALDFCVILVVNCVVFMRLGPRCNACWFVGVEVSFGFEAWSDNLVFVGERLYWNLFLCIHGNM